MLKSFSSIIYKIFQHNHKEHRGAEELNMLASKRFLEKTFSALLTIASTGHICDCQSVHAHWEEDTLLHKLFVVPSALRIMTRVTSLTWSCVTPIFCLQPRELHLRWAMGVSTASLIWSDQRFRLLPWGLLPSIPLRSPINDIFPIKK